MNCPCRKASKNDAVSFVRPPMDDDKEWSEVVDTYGRERWIERLQSMTGQRCHHG